MGMYQSPPPFIPAWGEGVKKKKQTTERRGLLLGKNTAHSTQFPYSDTHIVKFHKYILMSNQDLIQWGKYLGIPVNNVLSRD